MEYIIFDLDGTLIDSMPVWYDVGKNYLLKHQIPWEEDILNTIKNFTLKQTGQYFHETFDLPYTPEEIERDIVKIVEDAYRFTVEMKPFVREFLDKKAAEGTKMCILTASNTHFKTISIN